MLRAVERTAHSNCVITQTTRFVYPCICNFTRSRLLTMNHPPSILCPPSATTTSVYRVYTPLASNPMKRTSSLWPYIVSLPIPSTLNFHHVCFFDICHVYDSFRRKRRENKGTYRSSKQHNSSKIRKYRSMLVLSVCCSHNNSSLQSKSVHTIQAPIGGATAQQHSNNIYSSSTLAVSPFRLLGKSGK